MTTPLNTANAAKTKLLKGCRTGLAAAGGFSLVLNVLMLGVPLYTMQVFDRVLPSRSFDTLFFLTLIAVAAMGLFGFLEAIRSRVLQGIGTWFEAKVAPQALARSLGSPLHAANDGQVLRDVASVRQFLTGPALVALFDAPWMPVYLAALWLLDPLLGTIAMFGAGVLLALALVNGLATRKSNQDAAQAGLEAQAAAENTLRNRESADVMGMTGALIGRWASVNATALDAQNRAGNISAAIVGVSKFVRMSLQVMIMGAGAYLVIEGNASAGVMMAASILMGRALGPVEQAITLWRSLAQAREGFRRIAAFHAVPTAERGTMKLPTPDGNLAVERVAFAHQPGQPAVLKGVSFDLKAGRMLTVLGNSGSGKSTLARLIVGAAKPMGGAVRLDGADVFAWSRDDFGRHVGYLAQDVHLFDGTVAENIARMAEVDADAVTAAAKLAGVHELILRLPQGYETKLGKGGITLSGGQRQRIALARACYGNPRLVVLDEPNASLDTEGEKALMTAIEGLKQAGATVVVITHRPNLLRLADDVLVLRDGQVEKFGPRDEVFPRPAQPVAMATAPAAAAGAATIAAPAVSGQPGSAGQPIAIGLAASFPAATGLAAAAGE